MLKEVIIFGTLLLMLVNGYGLAITEEPSTGPECSNGVGCADVVFLVDGSGSIGTSGYNDELQFVANLVDSFPSEINSGVIVFSHFIYMVLPIASNLSADAVTSLSYPGGGTNIGLAIIEAQKEFANNGRQECVKHLIVLTDGFSGDDVVGPSMAARASNITTYAIGIGSNVDLMQLESIAGDSSRVFTVDSTASLLNEIDIESSIIVCDETPSCNMMDYCCQPVLVAPYTDYYGSPRGSDVRIFGHCQALASIIVDFGTCTNYHMGFRWEIDWGDGVVVTGSGSALGPFGPVVHTYSDYKYCYGGAEVSVKYCHNSMNYMDECCDSFTHYLYNYYG